jgi:hypothetical protein
MDIDAPIDMRLDGPRRRAMGGHLPKAFKGTRPSKLTHFGTVVLFLRHFAFPCLQGGTLRDDP